MTKPSAIHPVAGRGPGLLAWLLLTFALALAPLGSRAAGPVSDADSRAVRAVVEAQLKAFAADDADTAFSYASPGIRSQFRDASTFMAMVRSGYPMVLRPASTAFYQPTRVDDVLLQVVRMRDQAGRFWRATYQLEQQPAGWRIGGCVVQPEPPQAIT